MPASNAFVNGLLEVVERHIAAFGGNKAAMLALVGDISKIPAGNQSVAITQHRLWDAAKERWS